MWVLFASALASIWGSNQETGASSLAAPHELVTTLTLSVAGWWPWLRSGPDGLEMEPGGLALGGGLTLVAILLLSSATG